MAESVKPKCKLIGEDGNAFLIIGRTYDTLKRNGQLDKAKEMSDRCFNAPDYNTVLTIVGEYVEIE